MCSGLRAVRSAYSLRAYSPTALARTSVRGRLVEGAARPRCGARSRRWPAQRIAQTGNYERNFATGEFTVSAEAQRIFGVEPGAGVHSCVHPEDRPRSRPCSIRWWRERDDLWPGISHRSSERRVQVIRDEGQMTSPQAGARHALGRFAMSRRHAARNGNARTAHAAGTDRVAHRCSVPPPMS
jgi:hypothetical protein